MDMEWYRDLAVTILGFTVTVVFIILGVILVLMYLKVSRVFRALGDAAADICAVTAAVRTFVTRPTTRIFGVIKGIQDGLHSVVHHARHL